MQQLTPEGRQIIEGLAQRHGFSFDAVTHMLGAMAAGFGNQAQFNHFEFGGMGQWSSGGMMMIGDMFNNNLKSRVGALCQDLAGLVQGQPLFVVPAQSQSQSGGWQAQGSGGFQQQSSNGVTGSSLFVSGGSSGNWWPGDLGSAGSVGAQNNMRYAYFPNARRLAIDVNGTVTVYDTGEHSIGGFSQQQSGDQSLLFTSQFGLVRVADLPVVAGGSSGAPAQVVPAQRDELVVPDVPAPVMPPAAQAAPATSPAAPAGALTGLTPDEIFSAIEKLSSLHQNGILTEAEFTAKKAELLSRL